MRGLLCNLVVRVALALDYPVLFRAKPGVPLSGMDKLDSLWEGIVFSGCKVRHCCPYRRISGLN